MKNNSEILNLINKKSLIPIGWGTGDIFKSRNFIHDFEVDFTIDTRGIIDNIDGVKVKTPDFLEKIDREKYLLIIYSSDFLEEIVDYLDKFKDINYLPFNSNLLGTSDNLEKLREAYLTLNKHGVSYLNLIKKIAE